MKINKREFVRGINKYLNTPGTYELVSWGKVVNTVVIDSFSCAPNEVKIIPVEEVKAVVASIRPIKNEYGCGCEKVEKKYLCPKHSRC